MPVPFLSFEGLRNRLANNTPPSLGSGALDYGAASGQFLDELDSTDGSDDETPRHYQLQPLKKEAPVLCKSPEPISSTNGPSQPQDPKDIHVLADDNASKSEEDLAEEISASNGAPKEKECATGDTSPATIPSTTRSPLDDQELLNAFKLYYVNLIFPVLHELAGFSLSSQELLMVSKREPAIRTALVAQAKHHQNRMKFLTSTDGPHHQTTQKLCVDLATSNNAYVNALGALSPVFEKATRASDIDTLAVLYTLLHFGGIGELLTRHIARRGNQGSGGSFLLELSCRWLASSIARYTDLASALRRGSDRQRAVIQAAINIDIYSSIALCRPPHFLDSYRASFRHGDISTTVDSNGVRMAVPRLDDLMDIPTKTLLAFAEMSAMASWKAEHLRHGTLSVVDLSRWGKRIEVLLAPPSAEMLLNSISLSPSKSPHPVAHRAGNHSPAGPSKPTSAAKPSQADTEPTPTTAGASSPAISNPIAPMPRMTRIVKSEEESVKPSSPVVATSSVEQTAAGTLPHSTPIIEAIDHEMSDCAAVTRVAPNRSSSERLALPRASPLNQMPRPQHRRILPPATREVFRCAGRSWIRAALYATSDSVIFLQVLGRPQQMIYVSL
ncbi:hypothetical protein BN14_00620 [Rhizoctonia solani AG-1 IB]|uniref:Uncharacterized protein n=1 Tax=Thanatephorus cucumeris (strain AG1-IB / isolate 7/3/14) TaxID=1108050 RepID=M5BS96_THACB|nr:hypothetical protein BN14_00620 [Rhizoctonia solani AG-1 IB]